MAEFKISRMFRNRPEERAFDGVQKQLQDELEYMAERAGHRVLRFSELTFTERGARWVGRITAFTQRVRRK